MLSTLKRPLVLCALAVMVALLATLSLIFAPSSRAVVRGDEVKDAKPWAVQVFQNGEFKCSGSLIGEKAVLTVAHCLVNTPAQQLTVRIGSLQSGQGILRAVKSTAVNPGYLSGPTKDKSDHDLGVIGLFTAAGQQAVPLSNDVHADDILTFFGYGSVDDGKLASTLQSASNVVFSDSPAGLEMYQPAYVKGEASFGDSGGPWLNDANQQVALTSREGPCNEKKLVGKLPKCLTELSSTIATKIAPNRDWIRRTAGV